MVMDFSFLFFRFLPGQAKPANYYADFFASRYLK